MSMNVVWILTGIVVVVGFVALVSYFVRRGSSGASSPMPKTTQYDLQDAPPRDPDVPSHAGQQPGGTPPSEH